MTLNDFEKDFPQAILQRGKKYYVSGAVQSVEKIAVNTYQADVYGSDLYEVTVELDAAKLKTVREQMSMMEQYIRRFSAMERKGDVDGMTDTLIRITERVAEVRRLYQPGFPLPTFAEIRRVVQDEWDEDMGKIDPQEANTTADQGKRETDEADSQPEVSEA